MSNNSKKRKLEESEERPLKKQKLSEPEKKSDTETIPEQKVVTKDEWLKARKELLKAEKEFEKTKLEMRSKRAKLPIYEISTDYEFVATDGKTVKMSQLFNDKSNNNLIVYHLMFDPNDSNACKWCQFFVDNFNGICKHLQPRSNIIVIGKANYKKLLKLKERKKWDIEIYSSLNNNFNLNFGVEYNENTQKNGKFYNYDNEKNKNQLGQSPGLSVFKKKNNKIYHYYSTYAAGLSNVNVIFGLLDLLPEGRNEQGKGNMYWIKEKENY